MKKPASLPASSRGVEDVILFIRGHRVMLDRDLANLYGVTTFNLNKAVHRNRERFPGDFMFQLIAEETKSLIFQSGISKKRGGSRHFPHAFTQEGIAMLSSVLRSKRAVQVNISIMRAFIKVRAMLGNNLELARKLVALESELKSRLDIHEAAIVDVLQRIMRILDPPPLPPEPPPPEIGFHIKEDAVPYRIGRKTAKQQLREMQMQRQLDERAWISVDGVGLELPYSAGHVGIYVAIKNSGRTPAAITRMTRTIECAINGVTNTVLILTDTNGFIVAPSTKYPSELQDLKIGENDFDSLSKKRIDLHFMWKITYLDAFTNVRHTDFGFILNGTTNDMAPGTIFRPYGGQRMD